MTKKLSKIRKTFDSNVSFANENDESSQETQTSTSSEKTSSKKILQDSLSSNIELTIENKSVIATVDSHSNNKENLLDTQGTDTLEGLDDLFDEEWSYKKDTQDDLEDLFNDEWDYDKEATIDFSSPTRCTIIDVIWNKSDITLTVKDSNDIHATVKCFGIW